VSMPPEAATLPVSRRVESVARRRLYRGLGISLIAAVTIAQAAYYNAPAAGLGETSTLVIALAFAAVCAVLAARRAEDPLERLFWRLFTVCGGLVLLGRVYLAFTGDQHVPSVATYLDIAAAVVFLVNLSFTTRFRDASLASRLRYLTDLTAALSAAFVVAFALWLRPLFDYSSLPLGTRIAASLYPAAGLLMVVGVVNNLAAGPSRRAAWEMFLGGGFALAGFACVLWPYWYVDLISPVVWIATPMIEVLWVAGVGMLGLAAMFRVTETSVAWRPLLASGAWRRKSSTQEVIAWFTLLIAVPSFATAAIVGGSTNRWLFVVGMIWLATLAVARATVTAIESESRAKWTDKDALTGLHGPATLRSRLEGEITTARRLGDPCAVVMLDVDDLAYVNEALGYARGDKLLRRVGRMLASGIGPHDVSCRLEADSFVLLFPGMDDVAAVEASAAVCERIARQLDVTLSAGVAVFPEHGQDADALIRAAEDAVRVSKCEGKNCATVYDETAASSLTRDERLRLLQERSRLATVRLVATGVDERHPRTAGHSRRVALLVSALATRIGLSRRRVRLLTIAALVHDVGKVGVSDALLGSQVVGTEAERRMMEEHPVLSARIVASTGLTDVALWVEAHHERWDGLGYPKGLAGEDIPLEARILAVCDAFDSSTRGQNGNVDISRAVADLHAGSGSKYDSLLAERLAVLVTEGRREAS